MSVIKAHIHTAQLEVMFRICVPVSSDLASVEKVVKRFSRVFPSFTHPLSQSLLHIGSHTFRLTPAQMKMAGTGGRDTQSFEGFGERWIKNQELRKEPWESEWRAPNPMPLQDTWLLSALGILKAYETFYFIHKRNRN